MVFGKSLRRRPRAATTAVQALESRELKSASAGFNGAELTVTGTEGKDWIQILHHPIYCYQDGTQATNMTLVKINTQEVLLFQNANLKSIRVLGLGGDDRVDVSNPAQNRVEQLSIDLGGGGTGRVNLGRCQVGTVSIWSNASSANRIAVFNSQVASLTVDTGFGSFDPIWNSLFPNTSFDRVILSSSQVGSLRVNTRAGNDVLTLEKTTIGSHRVSLGAGDDIVFRHESYLGLGTLDAGTGFDTYLTTGWPNYSSNLSGGLTGTSYIVHPASFESCHYLVPAWMLEYFSN